MAATNLAAIQSEYRNRRLISQLEISSGRRQFVLTGQLSDVFVVDLFHGALNLEQCLEHHGKVKKYECVLFINSEGKVRFATPAMERIFDKTVRQDSVDPNAPPTGQTRQFQPRSRDTGEGATNQAAQQASSQVSDAAESAVLAKLEQVTRMLKSTVKTMVVVRDPELLVGFQAGQEDLRKLQVVLSWCKIYKGNRRSCSALLVDSDRMNVFNQYANMCPIHRENFTKLVDLGLPDQSELTVVLQRVMARRSLVGDPKRMAAIVQTQNKPLVNTLHEIADYLYDNPEARSLDSVYSGDGQAKTLDEILKSLTDLVGLESVKAKVQELIQLATNAPDQVQSMSHHMFFLGNPGTGKTVVAKLLGELYWALGIRPQKVFVACSHQDIISPYNEGDTIERMQQKINEAMGGVLFIDEVYTLAQHAWGAKALETLMVAMEDSRDKLTVIMAGYAEHLPEIYRVNPGLKSRVPHRFDFPDYSTIELVEIFERMLKGKKLTLEPAAKKKLNRYIQAFNQMGGMDNARGVRNIFEATHTAYLKSPNEERIIEDSMIPEPICFREGEARNILDKLDEQFVGLSRVKNFLEELFIKQKLNEQKGGSIGSSFNHCIFSGNPGTGKTSVARKMGNLFHYMGLVSEKDRFVEIGTDALISKFSGEFAEKTREKFDEAVGGVLFIDEAYRLADDDQGRKVIDQIVQLITEPKYRNLVVILAGYSDEMTQLMKTNAGLGRRFPHQVHFDDFSPDELVQIFHGCVTGGHPAHHIPESEQPAFDHLLQGKLAALARKKRFGNAGEVQSFFENVVQVNQGRRLLKDSEADPLAIWTSDLDNKQQADTESIDDILDELEQKFIGLQSVKDEIRELAYEFEDEMGRSRRLGISQKSKLHHMLFVGGPGTGKTTIARYMSRVFKALGVVTHGDEVYECRGLDLKGSFLGQTKDRVNELFENAAGKVVLIDEAYSLYDPESNAQDQYGQEAIDALVGCITDTTNQDIVLILAGYPKKMASFLNANPGLSRRFPTTIKFPNYTADECVEIFKMFARQERYEFEDQVQDCLATLEDLFESLSRRSDFGNAGEVANLWNKTKRIIRRRVRQNRSNSEDSEIADSKVTVEDVQNLAIELTRL